MKMTKFAIEQLNHPPPSVAYFNNAGKVPLPPSVQLAGQNAVLQESNPWDTSANTTAASQVTDQIRSLFGQIIGADGSDIAITPSTGFSLTMVAHNLLRTGVLRSGGTLMEGDSGSGSADQILILQDEMSSEVYCWQEVCKESGCRLVIVQHPTSEEKDWTRLIIDQLEDESNQNIKVVCVPQVHWSDGSYIDLKRVGYECHRRNIVFVVDGTQSVGIFPIDVKEIQCHILTASVHKWLLSAHGTCLVYVNRSFHETWLPLDQHERSRVVFQDTVYDATEDNIGPCGYPEEFVAGAARLDSGGKKNPVLLPMVCEGLRIVNGIDKFQAQIYLKTLTDRILTGGEKLGFGVQPGPRAAHIIGLRPKSEQLSSVLTPKKMVEMADSLKEKGVFLAVRCGAFRIAPYLDTTMEDVERLLKALKEECDKILCTSYGVE